MMNRNNNLNNLLKLRFRKDYIENRLINKLTENNNVSSVSTSNNTFSLTNLRIPIVNIQNVLTNANKLIVFLRRFENSGYIFELKVHFIYTEKLKFYIDNLENLVDKRIISPVVLERFKEILKTLLEYYHYLKTSDNKNVSEKGLFLNCLNSQLLRQSLEFENKICPVCIMEDFGKFLGNFKPTTQTIDEFINSFELENDIKFSKRDEELLRVISEYIKLFNILRDVWFKVPKVILPAIIYRDDKAIDNDILDIRNYRLVYLHFNKTRDLHDFINPIVNKLNQKMLSLSEVNKIFAEFEIVEIETENGQKFKSFKLLEDNNENNILVDNKVDLLIADIIEHTQKKYNTSLSFNVFDIFYNEINDNIVRNDLVYNRLNINDVEFIENTLSEKIDSLIRTIKEELEIRFN
jgi:hypothetical protein